MSLYLKCIQRLHGNKLKSDVSVSIVYTVEPIFNDISNSDNCCYSDRFANPRFFVYLSHVIYFYNDEYKKSLSSVITITWSESLGVKWKETQSDFA